MKRLHQGIILFVFVLWAIVPLSVSAADQAEERSKLAYIVSDLRIPFWDIMRRGIASRAEELGYQVKVYSADNDARGELENVVQVIREDVDGIIVSPTNSSACVTILKLANQAGIPVVISDIGTDDGEYVSYISSDNEGGAYALGQVLAKAMAARGWQDGSVGIIAIPQKRANGQARTEGFMRALSEVGIKGAGLRQQVTFSYQETYDYATELLTGNAEIRALWLQGSDRYQGALDAIRDAGRQGEVLLITFDAEPEFLDMISKSDLVGAGMQQPFLMGEKAVESMDDHLSGRAVPQAQQLPVLAISQDNISENLPIIRRNVLGLLDDQDP